jgi:hypothetical protein
LLFSMQVLSPLLFSAHHSCGEFAHS